MTRRNGTAWRQPAAIAAAVAMLTGCAVGPDYVRPHLPASAAYSPAPLPATTPATPVPGGAAQHFTVGRDIGADWWTLLQSQPLDALIEKAFAANPSIESAQAALRAAHEAEYAQRGLYFPTVQAGYTPSRTKVAGNLSGSSAPGPQGDGTIIGATPGAPVIFDFHTAQLTVGFVPDVFGGNRRQVEALAAQATVQQFQLEATYVTLASNIAAAAIQDALLRRQIAITREIVDADTAAADVVRRQHQAGYVSRLDLAAQENALAQARQALPPLQKQLEQNRDLLRALSGAAQDTEVPAFDLDALQLPDELPLSLPSRLVEQRPDVRAAEEQLHAASAQIGVARANRLPQFSINGTAGGAAAHFDQMFRNSGQFFNLALNITQPLFDGGTLMHRERAATETFRQAAAQYRSTVITAFQNVADTLHAIHTDAAAMQAAAEVAETSRTQLELIRRQHSHGYLDRLALITAEQAWRQSRLNLAQTQANRMNDTVALFVSLGGGWWHRTTDDVARVEGTEP
ncbi:hypothetical protein CDA09_20500 [Azoarcus sp. DN11]|nr:hypothetical protein CDA09_20500 [Azoarcus sp. DN11]